MSTHSHVNFVLESYHVPILPFTLVISNPNQQTLPSNQTIDVSLCNQKAMSCHRQNLKQNPLMQMCFLSSSGFCFCFFLAFLFFCVMF